MTEEPAFPAGDNEHDAAYAEEASMIDAGELIAASLEASALTKIQLAEKLAISEDEMSARLAGERDISLRALATILHALGSTLELSARHYRP